MKVRITKQEAGNPKPEIGRVLISGFRILVSAFLISGFWLQPARAACFNPAGNAGDVVYSGGVQAEIYCNGGAWISMGGPVGNTTSGLVGWWKLDDGSGTSAADSSGSGNTGTLVNTPAWTTGMNGGALSFNGSNQYINIPDSPSLEISGAWTISTWVNLAAFPSTGNFYPFFGKVNGTTGVANYRIGVENWGGTPTFFIQMSGFLGNNYAYDSTGEVLTTGTWYHLAAVWDPTVHNLYLYVNGTLAGTQNYGTDTPQYNFSDPVLIGANSFPSTLTIDDARVYNRALSAQDIKTLYTSTGGMSGDITTGLKGYWKFDEGSGTAAADSSGSGNNGTLTNGPTWTTGKINGALSFDGVDDYVSVANNSSLNFGAADFTITAWIKTTNASLGQSIVSHFNSSDYAGFDFAFSTGDTNCVAGKICFWDGTNWTSVTSGIASSQYTHVAAVRSGTSMTFYVNGAGTGTTTVSASIPASTNTFNIGQSGQPASPRTFSGTIDDVRVYNRALSASDVLTLYNMTATSCASPTGYTGDMIYNGGTHHVMQYCNASNWIPMGPLPGAGGSGCTGPAGSEGDIIYNSANHVAQYCDGTNWNAFGGIMPVASGLVGWWNFDEGSGTTAADSSGNNNTGTLINSPTWTTSGRINGALTLNGTNQYVDVPYSSSIDLTGTNLTIAAWVNISAVNGDYQAIFGKDFQYRLLLGANLSSFLFQINSSTNAFSNTFAALTFRTWHHVAVTYNGTTVNFYLDGQNVGSVAMTQSITSTGVYDAGIGNSFTSYYFLEGSIDDVRVYNRALSAKEVWQLYNGT